MEQLLILVVSFVIILLGAELFTNGIEWFGRKLELAEGAVGSVLAAVGTALPETMIPIIAIGFASGESTHAIGVGAILGAPFMLATLAMFVTGVAVLVQARRRPTGDVMPVDPRVLRQDMGTFAVAYTVAIGAAFLPAEPTWPKIAAAALLHPHLRALREAALRGGSGRRRRGPRTAPLPAPRSRAPASPGGAAPPGGQPPGDRGPRAHHRRGGRVRRVGRAGRPRDRRGRGPARARRRARSRRSCPRSSTRSSGFARARTRWRWATSRARWSSRRASRRSWRWSSPRHRGSPGRARTRPLHRPGSPSLSSAAIFIPMARNGRLRGRGLLVGGAVLRRLSRARRGSVVMGSG